MKYRSPLKKVKGLGAAKSGTGHFIHQRLTGLFLIPLVVLFMCVLISMLTADSFADIKSYFENPFWVAILTLFLVTAFYHGVLGIQVVIEDYIHHEVVKVLLLATVRFACLFFVILAIISIFKMAFA